MDERQEIHKRGNYIVPFHVEDGGLDSLSYLKEGAAKVWYICFPRQMRHFEQFFFKQLFNIAYLNYYKNGGKHIFSQEDVLFTLFLSRVLDAALSSHLAT